MSDNTYHVVDVDLTDAEELKPDVHLEVAGAKLDLPNLNNAELPIELVQAILLVKSGRRSPTRRPARAWPRSSHTSRTRSRTSGPRYVRPNARWPTSSPR